MCAGTPFSVGHRNRRDGDWSIWCSESDAWIMDPIQLPPIPKLIDYPASIGIGIGIIFTAALLYVSGKFDPTHGALTISIMVVLAFISTVMFVSFFTVPSNEITSSVIGGLIAAFGAVVSYWLNHPGRGPPPPL